MKGESVACRKVAAAVSGEPGLTVPVFGAIVDGVTALGVPVFGAVDGGGAVTLGSSEP